MSRILFLLLIVLFAATLPACQIARSNFLKSEFGSVVPLPPNGEPSRVDVNPKYTSASLKVEFKSRKTPAEIVAYYQRELAARGFSLVAGSSHGDPLPASPDASPATSPAALQPSGCHHYEFKRGNDIFWLDFIELIMSWRSGTEPCEVTIILRHESYMGESAKLPVVLPVMALGLPLLPTGEGYAMFVGQWSYPIIDLLY